MNYDLAKQLMDSGFPQGTYPRLMIDSDGSIVDEESECSPVSDKAVLLPTLSELIEACGKEHDGPNRNTKEQKPIHHLFRLGWGDQWFATYEFYESMLENEYGQPLIEYGNTPEEAVGNLWLALNTPVDKRR